ncbi:MAG TPA: ElyC/SanA/YdcF family protein [Syntrophorhabdaceae bacterium]|nr:ElyC/SanA/YdcF family protein [Syntrophorhabdaceae bacterium]
MKLATILIISLAVLAGTIVCAPYFLLRSDEPSKSDVIVLHLGGGTAQRKNEVHKLIEEGYAANLAIPAYGRLSDVSTLFPMTKKKANKTLFRGRVLRSVKYPKYYEDTHIEILEAKKLMDQAGLKSAIFVSSPYHMRRISLIADKVFGKGGYELRFVPSRFEKRRGIKWFLNKRERNFVMGEYSKIVWFSLYRFFA